MQTIFFILSLALPMAVLAQAPAYNGFPPPAAVPADPVQPEASPAPAAVPAEKKEEPAPPVAGGMNKYDPYLDNHMRAPAPEAGLGLFGMKIKDVEQVLRQYGAKNYSYAFGKYSRMTISAYLVTMYFDRERRLGGVAIEPKPPYQAIAPDARKFFFDLFLKDGDLSKFRAVIANDRLELKYSERQ